MSVPLSLKSMSKEHKKIAGEERVVSRCHVRDPMVLALTASESPRKTKSESQNVPLSSFNVQQTSTVRPVLGASSSNYSEWKIDDKWSSSSVEIWWNVEHKYGRPENDKFVIDDDMDSDTATESNLSLKSRSFLKQSEWLDRKMLDRSPEDSMQDIDKRSMIWWMIMSSTLEASVFMGKNYSDNLHHIKNTWENLTLKQMFRRYLNSLILEQSG